MTWLSKGYLASLVLGVFVLIILQSCRRNDLDSYNPVLNAANERDLGNILFQEIIDNPNVYPFLSFSDYPEVYAYLNQALQMVETRTDIRDFYGWEVLVLDDDEIQNAYTLPGGKILLTTGLLKYLDGEHQLIELLAHEAYYINRENDGAPTSLSLIMQKMKFSFINNRGLGTKIFLDAIEGDSVLNFDMIHEAKIASYDPSIVFDADVYAVNMICDNYLYPPNGLREIIQKAETDENIEFVWLNNKPPSLTYAKPPEFTLETRMDNLLIHETPCNDNEYEETNLYAEMVSQLP